jgi:hypothetical protein
VLKRFFGTDSFVGPQCHLQPEGTSVVEPRRFPGHPEFIKGLNDVPNSGLNSLGYSPARDTVLCWDTFSAAARQAAASRCGPPGRQACRPGVGGGAGGLQCGWQAASLQGRSCSCMRA